MTSANVCLTRLLDRGFYPVELPPCLKAANFSGVRNTLNPPENCIGSTTFFDGSTHKGHLRTFGVINPISYALLARLIAQEWQNVSQVFRLSNSLGARPKSPPASKGGRAMETASLASKRRSQQHMASCYPVAD